MLAPYLHILYRTPRNFLHSKCCGIFKDRQLQGSYRFGHSGLCRMWFGRQNSKFLKIDMHILYSDIMHIRPDSKVYGANVGPTWGRQRWAPCWPHDRFYLGDGHIGIYIISCNLNISCLGIWISAVRHYGTEINTGSATITNAAYLKWNHG